jgi:hypothetical protein
MAVLDVQAEHVIRFAYQTHGQGFATRPRFNEYIGDRQTDRTAAPEETCPICGV